jgi:transposase
MKVEEQPVNIAVVARMFCQKVKTFYHWYKHFLSDYFSDKESGKWCSNKIDLVDVETGEITGEKPLYVFKPENVGENMSIDDKAIGRDGFTILSNSDTGKIAMMVESVNSVEVEAAMELFGNNLKKVKNISMDMSATYSLVSDNLIPTAKQVIDKYHVMKYAYDAVSGVRNKIRKSLSEKLSKEKRKTSQDKQILSELELLKRVRHAVTQSPEKWSQEMKITIKEVFDKHNELKMAYQISQNFKQWYDYGNHKKPRNEITKNLYTWYEQATEVKEFKSVIKMIRKHEDEIINFFQNGITNAKAERLNGKIKRFVTNNYGIKDKDFILYRIAGYFS